MSHHDPIQQTLHAMALEAEPVRTHSQPWPSPELIAALEEMTVLLESYEEQGWAGHFQQLTLLLKSGETHALYDLILAYEDFKNFQDLLLHPNNGHTLALGQVDPANADLQEIRQRVYRLAKSHQQWKKPNVEHVFA